MKQECHTRKFMKQMRLIFLMLWVEDQIDELMAEFEQQLKKGFDLGYLHYSKNMQEFRMIFVKMLIKGKTRLIEVWQMLKLTQAKMK